MSKKAIRAYTKAFSDNLSISNANLQKILKFFLFECPVPGTSVRGNKFYDFGIKGSSGFSKLRKKMLDLATDSLRHNYKPCKKDELQLAFDLMNNVSPPDEYCVFLKYDEKLVMESLYSAIRNAFAHGSFCIKRYSGTRIYFLSNYDGYLKAEIVLHEDTLLGWMDCIKSFTNDLY